MIAKITGEGRGRASRSADYEEIRLLHGLPIPHGHQLSFILQRASAITRSSSRGPPSASSRPSIRPRRAGGCRRRSSTDHRGHRDRSQIKQPACIEFIGESELIFAGHGASRPDIGDSLLLRCPSCSRLISMTNNQGRPTRCAATSGAAFCVVRYRRCMSLPNVARIIDGCSPSSRTTAR